jgi:hypothetical protein
MESIERRPAVVVVLNHPFEGQSQVTEDKDEYQDISLFEPGLVKVLHHQPLRPHSRYIRHVYLQNQLDCQAVTE